MESSSAVAGTETPTAQSPAASFDDTVTRFVGDSPGGVEVLFDWNGNRQHATAGVATYGGEELTPGRAFRVGSVSKTFVAVMVLQLVDEGAVDLDTELVAYLPGAVVGSDATVRQLLSHRSGIVNYTEQSEFQADVLADRSRRMTVAEVLSSVADVPAGPVGQFVYSNTNYILLGQLIEALDGTDLNTSLAERVTGPLGLDGTTFDTGDGSLPVDLVGGWSQAGDDGDPTLPYAAIASSAWAAGSLISTADDLAAFLVALTSGELISAESFAAMTETGTAGYGLGLFEARFSATQSGYAHSGSILGFSSTMAVDPSTGDTLIILTNNDALVADRLAAEILATQ